MDPKDLLGQIYVGSRPAKPYGRAYKMHTVIFTSHKRYPNYCMYNDFCDITW